MSNPMWIPLAFLAGYGLSTLLTTIQFRRLNNAKAYEELGAQVREISSNPRLDVQEQMILDQASVALTWGGQR
jgi:hypothetical protein